MIFDKIMKYISVLLAGVLAVSAALAQDIQTLPVDPAVKSGVLPNGITFYVVSNPSASGVADFALVQKTGALTIPGSDRSDVVAASQEALSSQSRLLAPTVQDYFMKQGVIPGRKGFAYVTDNATVFHFQDVPVGRDACVVDSTLLVMMGMVEKTAGLDGSVTDGWYSPSDQALIVAGDVDSKQIADKLKMLSYMVPSAESLERKAYVWTEQDSVDVGKVEDPVRDLVTVSAVWRLQRTPRELMNTVQPAIYERFMTELGIVAESRIRKRLKTLGVPYADVSYDFIGGVESLTDEGFRMTVSVAPRDLEVGISSLASVLSGLDASDARVFEVSRARLVFMDMLSSEGAGSESNSDYVDRCISSYMYNSPLTSRKDMMDFHSSRSLSDEEELGIFNSIVSASIDGSRNLTLEYMAKDTTVSADRIMETFASSWKSGHQKVETQGQPSGNILTLSGPSEPIKVKSSRRERMSDGTIWTLSNGFKVAFKQMPTDNVVYYSLALNGGYANIPDLQAGEGGYMSDILKVSRIGGVDSEKFYDVIRHNGISMKLDAGFSMVTVSGTVPDDGLDYLLSLLLTVMNDRRIDRDRLDYYTECERLRQEFVKGSVVERISAIDGILCPDYRYSSVKAAESLSESFADHADALMESLSGKMNSGMLVLVGDVDEKKLKAALQMYAGGFRTEKRSFARPVVSYQPISGTVTRFVEGESNSVDMVASTPMALTADNYYLAAIASMALKNGLTRALAGSGMWLKLSHDCRPDPHERYNVMISLNEASVEGFVPGTVHGDPMLALKTVREILADPQSMEITDAELASYKSMLKKHVERQKKNPQYWLRAIPMRYLEGKDFTTGCDARIDLVTVPKVKALLSSLSKGSRVEYIISKK